MRSILNKIADRCDAVMKKLEDYASGNKESSFASEEAFKDSGINILKDKTWHQSTIDDLDEVCFKDDDSLTQNIAEFQEAYTLQRDMNYIYSERKKLFQSGLDTKIGDEYRGGLMANLYKEIGDAEQKTSIS